MPVSYTHLDVYKRQVLQVTPDLNPRPVFVPALWFPFYRVFHMRGLEYAASLKDTEI